MGLRVCACTWDITALIDWCTCTVRSSGKLLKSRCWRRATPTHQPGCRSFNTPTVQKRGRGGRVARARFGALLCTWPADEAAAPRTPAKAQESRRATLSALSAKPGNLSCSESTPCGNHKGRRLPRRVASSVGGRRCGTTPTARGRQWSAALRCRALQGAAGRCRASVAE